MKKTSDEARGSTLLQEAMTIGKVVPPVTPLETLRVGDMVLVCHRGSAQLYPAWVTNLRGNGGREAHGLTLTMLWDKGSGVALIHNPVHISQRRGAERESWWMSPEEDQEGL